MYATLDIQSLVLLPINVATTPHHTTVHHLPWFVHTSSESTSGSSSLLILWSYGASILTPTKTPVILAIINTQDAEYEKKFTMAWSTMQTSSSTSSGPTKPAIGSLGQFSINSSPSKSQCKNYKYNLHHPHQSHHLHPSSSYTSTQPNQPTTKMHLSLTSLVSLLAAAQSASAWQSTSTTPPPFALFPITNLFHSHRLRRQQNLQRPGPEPRPPRQHLPRHLLHLRPVHAGRVLHPLRQKRSPRPGLQRPSPHRLHPPRHRRELHLLQKRGLHWRPDLEERRQRLRYLWRSHHHWILQVQHPLRAGLCFRA
ncbi:uncharacterized protein PODANS_5_9852 [Podospora anserina S mat+]|uniref:Podospora anserina S mat+ genomic DNA chromosome 5, supercontig 9 n=1 Tax=Podospora anserina (strain S / ATCC MYA-4624 / DSM 980 / FGSC 10383) TaxID=515849 RepID=B2AL77_PODAN|nr:uncharacterized protein PODANS_5_9852 [Podospora anserina S mat+]CAP64715.1 unnamed protein product [Podospora anserina S mat+]CDP30112.1 Putative protein of unknown function [Podospora anserina S mat+]